MRRWSFQSPFEVATDDDAADHVCIDNVAFHVLAPLPRAGELWGVCVFKIAAFCAGEISFTDFQVFEFGCLLGGWIA